MNRIFGIRGVTIFEHDRIRIGAGRKLREMDFWLSEDRSVLHVRKGMSDEQWEQLREIMAELREKYGSTD